MGFPEHSLNSPCLYLLHKNFVLFSNYFSSISLESLLSNKYLNYSVPKETSSKEKSSNSKSKTIARNANLKLGGGFVS